MMKEITMIEFAKSVAQLVADNGGQALMIGGCVRDEVFGAPSKDIDVEVYGLPVDILIDLLEGAFGKVNCVGKAFGVLKLGDLDISIPRRESKAGLGHKGFEIMSDPTMTPKEAARRRDFTMNTVYKCPLSGDIYDPYNGIEDMKVGILVPTSEQFAEDPLRVLRAAQFLARFELSPSEDLIRMSRELVSEAQTLPKERVWEELKKLLLKGKKPSLGFNFLLETGWLEVLFPEVFAMVGVQQDPTWHPEGDVYTHTMHVVDYAAAHQTGEDDLVIMLACLAHDFGKVTHTFQDENGRWRSPGHEEAGEEPTRNFLARVTREKAIVDAVVPLVVEHLKPTMLYVAQSSDNAIRRLASRVNLKQLVRVVAADHGGRPPLDTFCPAVPWILERAEALGIGSNKPEPIVSGKDLIRIGMKPGPAMGKKLAELYELQLDGVFTTLEAGLELALS